MRYIGILLQILLFSTAFGQYPLDNKRDHIWMFGMGYTPFVFSGTVMNFNNSGVSIDSVIQQPSLYLTNASISGLDGNLLFYTNGMQVANANHLVMPHGDSLNFGPVYPNLIIDGYSVPQGTLVLPKYGSNNLYYIIHEKFDYAPNPYVYVDTVLYYSMVNMNLIGGLGDVTQKNIPVLIDTLDPGAITACRHANGRDWWILIPEAFHNRYFRFLLCPQGMVLKGIQHIGSASSVGIPELGVACFSPDGSKYCRYGAWDYSTPYKLEVFDFDRCTGLLSNYHNLWFSNTIDSTHHPGIAISPNSKYLYITTDRRVIQYDLLSANIGGSEQTVANYDGFVDPQFILGNTGFGFSQLAPDNNIYITGGVSHYLHVIQNPDSSGWACNVIQHAIHLSTYNNQSIPNFPNFRLGPIDGSPCDTLGIDIVVGITKPSNLNEVMSIYPNPAVNKVILLWNNPIDEQATISLTNPIGQLVKSISFNLQYKSMIISTSDLKPDIYNVCIKTSTRIINCKKLAIIK